MPISHLVPEPGKQCVVALTFDNFGESYDLLKYGHAGGANADGVYAPRRGVGRILELLDEYRIPCTFFLEGWNVRKYADLAREIVERGHEIAAHGWMHEQWDSLDPEVEAQLIQRTTETIENVVGIRPEGWRSPGGLVSRHTLQLLHKAGYCYDSSYGDEDVPYLLQISTDSENRIVELPWRWTLDDAVYYSPSRTIHRAADVARLWIEEFDAALSMTGFFMLVCHPRYSGRPAQLRALQTLIEHMQSSSQVVFARCDEIARFTQYWEQAPSYLASESYQEETFQ